jgi:hypothetical protein
MSFDSAYKSRRFGSAKLVCAGACLLLWGLAIPARAQQPAPPPVFANTTADEPKGQLSADQNPLRPPSSQQTAPPQNPEATGSFSGKVVDQSGVAISGAKIKLTRQDPSIAQEALTDDDGQFSFANLAPGPYELTISSPNLTTQTIEDVLQPGQSYTLPLIMLTVATQVTEVHVGITPQEEARLEVKDAEKQRVFGFIPNFYVAYTPDPAPLTHKLKFELAWKSATDPVTLGAVGVLAGLEQATNKWKEYGQGAQGYGKRFGASYADVAAGTFIGNAILPSLFKQDPRYFYKGPGHSSPSRVLRALGGAFIAKHDGGGWEPNYSDIGGSLAAGAISNIYYPSNKRGVGLVFSTALIRLGEITAANFFEEFLSPKFTPNLPPQPTPQP